MYISHLSSVHMHLKNTAASFPMTSPYNKTGYHTLTCSVLRVSCNLGNVCFVSFQLCDAVENDGLRN